MKKNISRISHIVHQNKIFTPRDNFICSISGGQDSLLILTILYNLHEIYKFKINLLYFNHLWQKKNFYLNFHLFKLSYLLQFPVTIAISKKCIAGEERAREWRQYCFRKLTQYYNSEFVVVGHTASDQVETSLWHFLRGTSPKGLISLNAQKKIYSDMYLNEITSNCSFKNINSKRKFFSKKAKNSISFKKKFLIIRKHSFPKPEQIKNLLTTKVSKDSFVNLNEVLNQQMFTHLKLNVNSRQFHLLVNSYLFLYCSRNNSTYKLKRPLLQFYRATVTRVIQENKIPVCYDRTNKNLNFSRNKIRLVLLPLFNLYFQKKSQKQIKKYINISSQEQHYFNSLIRQAISCYWVNPKYITILKKNPRPISEQILLKILQNYFQKQVKTTYLQLNNKYFFQEKNFN